jgi:hypothetical protein
LNVQRVCYKGAKSIFTTRPEPASGDKWEELIKLALQKVHPTGHYVKVISSAQYGQYSVLFVRQESISQVSKVKEGLSIDISTGKGGQRTSKRGAISIDFSL